MSSVDEGEGEGEDEESGSAEEEENEAKEEEEEEIILWLWRIRRAKFEEIRDMNDLVAISVQLSSPLSLEITSLFYLTKQLEWIGFRVT